METTLRLHGLLNRIERWNGFPALLDRLQAGATVAVALPEGTKPYLLAAIQQRIEAPILVVTARPGRARELQEQIAVWSSSPDRVLLFPEPDSLPYERMPADPAAVAARLKVMAELAGWEDRGPASPSGRGRPSAARAGEGSSGLRHVAADRSGPHPDPLPKGEGVALTQHSALSTQHRGLVVVTCGRAMMERVMPPEELRRSREALRVGQRIQMQATLKRWVELGYEPVPVVEVPGSFSRRGGILDLFPPGSPIPYRIELFGDEIESIRSFDPATQRSLEQVEEITVTPPRELLPSASDQRSAFSNQLSAVSSQDSALSTQHSAPESSLLDYLPAGRLLVLDDPAQIAATCADLMEQSTHLQLQAVERGEIPAGLPPALLEWDEAASAARSRGIALLEMKYDPEAEELPFTAPPSYGGKVRLVLDEAIRLAGADTETRGHGDAETRGREDAGIQDLHATAFQPGMVEGSGRTAVREGERSREPLPPGVEGFGRASVLASRTRLSQGGSAGASPSRKTVVLVSQQSQRLAELLAELDQPVAPRQAMETEPGPGLHLVQGSLRQGWSSEQLGTVVLGDGEIFGWIKAHRVVRRRTTPREAFLSDLMEGELAVHIEHGIGRFRGLQRMSADGQEREYLVLEYSEGDKLYVPLDQADRVTRFIGAGEEAPNLSRLGTTEWSRAKERVRKSVQNVARELLDIYSARQAQTGHAFSPDTPWQGELEASFPYVETPDQLQAVQEVKADMENPRPMDRLICGDVGYGKTEVALRATFKAVMDGKQVAVLVPTTVLAQQHYNSFRERLQPFPVQVEVLSRFRSEREQRQVVEGLRTGAVDVCIGTHRLIQKDVQFKDLGLVIVDEEQRFGVMHKERLKQLRQQVDVLTLSATPIPRTLHMSLAGIRDMSTMETPPEDRLPIRTFVTEYSDNLVREALLRELDRGGQAYFVHNRVQNIHFVANHLQKLVPEARIVVGHGQMPEESLERVMMEFAEGQHDVLVCTTIIESGLDIPNVNTIVVNQADRFGLAQLYQLRGRVGRGANRAYAYFLYSKGRQLNETAEKRLKTIFEHTALGSGFRIAMKDLEIRGAGNLLGVEQHGQVNAVGFDLYTRLLSEAVAELQGKPMALEVEVTLDLPLAAHLPDDYVDDEAARLSLYQRLAALRKEEEVGGLVEEMQDRFGRLPVEAQNLFYLVNLRLLAAKAGIRSISAVEGEILVKLEGIPLPWRHRLERQYGPKVRVLPNQVRLQRGKGEGWVPVLQEIVEQLREGAEAATTR